MHASDYRIAVRNKAFYVVNVTTGTTVAGPFPTAFDAIEARQKLAQVDVDAVVDGRRRAPAYQRELEAVR